MENSPPQFSPLTLRQKFLLSEIESLKEKLGTLTPLDPATGTWVPEFYEIRKEIDEHTVKLIRSGAIKRGPDKGFSYPPEARTWAKKKGLDKPQIQHFCHPQLPSWAVQHLEDWVAHQRLRKEGRETLRETGVVGLETGMKRPIPGSDIERWEHIRQRVLELRGVETQEKLRKGIVVTDEMLQILELQCKGRTDKKLKRIRKNSATWDWIIEKLVKEGILSKKISQQAFKKMLKNRWPDFPWDKV